MPANPAAPGRHREQIERLTQDIADACSTLDRKGPTHEVERTQVHRGTGD
ncbi:MULTISPECIES: hypothetical protein [unclassified Streptomyces]|nr:MULTISPECIES: hypothetical protein [unclassified Streptomyces]WSR23711.1 hypothetical protein OG573_34655 [Streptomyces sp. NBC_01205]